MPNPIYQAMNGRPQNMGGFFNMIQQFNQFRSTFRGDPKAEVQKLLDSGRMSQEQYNQLAQTAHMFQQFIR